MRYFWNKIEEITDNWSPPPDPCLPLAAGGLGSQNVHITSIYEV